MSVADPEWSLEDVVRLRVTITAEYDAVRKDYAFAMPRLAPDLSDVPGERAGLLPSDLDMAMIDQVALTENELALYDLLGENSLQLKVEVAQ